MKRLLAFLFLFVVALPARAQVVTNPLTKVFVIPISGDCDTTPCSNASRSLCRESATSLPVYSCNTSTGFYVPVGSFAGASTTTYMIADPLTGCVQVWVDALLDWQFCPSHVIPPSCPTDTSSLPFGAMCKDLTTGDLLVRALRVRVIP